MSYDQEAKSTIRDFTKCITPTVDIHSMPALNDRVPGTTALFSWKSVRGKEGQGLRYFESTSWRGLVWIPLAARFFTAAVLVFLIR